MTWRCRLVKSTTSKVHDAERADSGRSQIQDQRRSQPARSDTEHLRLLQFELTVHADFRHDQVARVAQDFLVVERGDFFCDARHITQYLPPAIDGTMESMSPSFTAVCIILQISDVVVVEVEVHERAQFSFVAVKVFAEIRVGGRESV